MSHIWHIHNNWYMDQKEGVVLLLSRNRNGCRDRISMYYNNDEVVSMLSVRDLLQFCDINNDLVLNDEINECGFHSAVVIGVDFTSDRMQRHHGDIIDEEELEEKMIEISFVFCLDKSDRYLFISKVKGKWRNEKRIIVTNIDVHIVHSSITGITGIQGSKLISSPSVLICNNENLVAMGNSDGVVGVWDMHMGSSSNIYLHGKNNHPGRNRINALMFTDDGNNLISSGNDHLVIMWEIIKTKKHIHLVARTIFNTLEHGIVHSLSSFSISQSQFSQSLIIAAGTNCGRVTFWDSNKSNTLRASLQIRNRSKKPSDNEANKVTITALDIHICQSKNMVIVASGTNEGYIHLHEISLAMFQKRSTQDNQERNKLKKGNKPNSINSAAAFTYDEPKIANIGTIKVSSASIPICRIDFMLSRLCTDSQHRQCRSNLAAYYGDEFSIMEVEQIAKMNDQEEDIDKEELAVTVALRRIAYEKAIKELEMRRYEILNRRFDEEKAKKEIEKSVIPRKIAAKEALNFSLHDRLYPPIKPKQKNTDKIEEEKRKNLIHGSNVDAPWYLRQRDATSWKSNNFYIQKGKNGMWMS